MTKLPVPGVTTQELSAHEFPGVLMTSWLILVREEALLVQMIVIKDRESLHFIIYMEQTLNILCISHIWYFL